MLPAHATSIGKTGSAVLRIVFLRYRTSTKYCTARQHRTGTCRPEIECYLTQKFRNRAPVLRASIVCMLRNGWQENVWDSVVRLVGVGNCCEFSGHCLEKWIDPFRVVLSMAARLLSLALRWAHTAQSNGISWSLWRGLYSEIPTDPTTVEFLDLFFSQCSRKSRRDVSPWLRLWRPFFCFQCRIVITTCSTHR